MKTITILYTIVEVADMRLGRMYLFNYKFINENAMERGIKNDCETKHVLDDEK